MPKYTSESLSNFVQIRQSGLRSINLERDIAHTSLVDGYTFTAQAHSTLGQMLHRLLNRQNASCAWTMTGPYGSGKSYFSLFLASLLCPTLPAFQLVTDQLQRKDELLVKQIATFANLAQSKGFLPITITGYRATLQACLLNGLRRVITETLPSHPPLLEWLRETEGDFTTADSRQVVAYLAQLHQIVREELGYQGLLFVLDEMGKPLEYLASYPDEGDIYLLQELAEFADRSEQTILFIGILHQGFERYAGHLDVATQREWAKVQGRFADIAFQEPPHQQMALLAQSIVHQHSLPSKWEALGAEYAKNALVSGWKPAMLSDGEFVRLCRQAYPLHPTTLVALPHFFRRLAQNERSLFSYLGSAEPYGLQSFLQTHEMGEMVRLPHLFDYLVANFQGRVYASMRGRLITETVERLQSAPNLSPLATGLLKAIGLMNWLAEVSGLQSNKPALVAAMQSPTITAVDIDKGLQELIQRQLVVLRRFNNSYVIWQGSDVDLDERLQEATNKLRGVFQLAETVEAYLPPRPAVARGHSYRTGFTRFWQMRYVDANTAVALRPKTKKGFSGTVLVCLSSTTAEYESLYKWATAVSWRKKPDFLIGLAHNTERLSRLVYELKALYWVRENTPELRDDPVARRELRTRIQTLEILIRGELEQTLGAHRLAKGDTCRWFHQSQDITDQFGRGLSYLLSTLSDKLYQGSPAIWNELINRNKLSSQGAAARRNLIEGMWTRGDVAQVGIEGYPPERSMYESLLAKSGLHQQTEEDRWIFGPPPKSDPLKLKPVWEFISEWVFGEEPEQRSVAALLAQLSQPPYGLTEGIFPVLLCAFMLAYQNETTLYREGSLLPSPTVADWEVLLRRPELFSVVGIRVEGARALIVARLAESLGTDTAVLPIVRTLITQLRTLPDYSWRTQRLTPTTLALRHTIEKAHSPERLLFHDLPLALELPPFTTEQEADTAQIDAFFEALNNALQELANALPTVIATARDQLLNACGFPTGEDGWDIFRQEATVLLPYVNHPNLLPLVKRAAETSDPAAALESVLAFIANRPPRSWYDRDVAQFADLVIPLANLFTNERSGYDPLALLSPDEKEASQQLAQALLQYVHEKARKGTMNNDVVEAAVRVVLKQLDEQKEIG